MGGITIAWLAGLGIVSWRWAKAGAPPTPGTLALSSGYFILLAAIAEYGPARTAATMIAFGVDVAAFLQVLPGAKTPDTGWPPLPIGDNTTVLPYGKSEQKGTSSTTANVTPSSGGSGGSGSGGGGTVLV